MLEANLSLNRGSAATFGFILNKGQDFRQSIFETASGSLIVNIRERWSLNAIEVYSASITSISPY